MCPKNKYFVQRVQHSLSQHSWYTSTPVTTCNSSNCLTGHFKKWIPEDANTHCYGLPAIRHLFIQLHDNTEKWKDRNQSIDVRGQQFDSSEQRTTSKHGRRFFVCFLLGEGQPTDITVTEMPSLSSLKNLPRYEICLVQPVSFTSCCSHSEQLR